MSETADTLHDALAAAEDTLSILTAQAGEAYQRWRMIDGQQTAKAAEVRELQRQVREASSHPARPTLREKT